MEIIIKIDGSDSRQFIDAATKFAGAVQSFKPEDILDKVADVLGFLAADGNKDGASSGAPAAENTGNTPGGENVSHREDDILEVQRYLLSRGRYIGAIVDDEVSAQTLTALKSAGIVSVKELSEYSLKQLMRIDGMDKEGIKECRALLARQNLTLRGDEA